MPTDTNAANGGPLLNVFYTRLPAPTLKGNWRETANSNSTQPPRAFGSRKDERLLVRPTILDALPSFSFAEKEEAKKKKGSEFNEGMGGVDGYVAADEDAHRLPLFFPCAPQWSTLLSSLSSTDAKKKEGAASSSPSSPSSPSYSAAVVLDALLAKLTENDGSNTCNAIGGTSRGDALRLIEASAKFWADRREALIHGDKREDINCQCCGIDLSAMLSEASNGGVADDATSAIPPMCECGEVMYCSRQCAELDWCGADGDNTRVGGDGGSNNGKTKGCHKDSCAWARQMQGEANSSSAAAFARLTARLHRLYWEGCIYGVIDCPPAAVLRVRNYSVKYYTLRAAKGLGSTAPKAHPLQLNPAAFSRPLPEGDVTSVDELSYLMIHERVAMTKVCSTAQLAVKAAMESGDVVRRDAAVEDMCACLLELYLRMSSYSRSVDSADRARFKLMMAEMLHGVLTQMNLATYVEDLDAVRARFQPAFIPTTLEGVLNAAKVLSTAGGNSNKQ